MSTSYATKADDLWRTPLLYLALSIGGVQCSWYFIQKTWYSNMIFINHSHGTLHEATRWRKPRKVIACPFFSEYYDTLRFKIEVVWGAITALKMTFTVTYHSPFTRQRTWKETQHFPSKLYGIYTHAYRRKLLN